MGCWQPPSWLCFLEPLPCLLPRVGRPPRAPAVGVIGGPCGWVGVVPLAGGARFQRPAGQG